MSMTVSVCLDALCPQLAAPQAVRLLAGQGVQTVTVYAKPRAALMPTGDELCSPETPLRPGKIYDSNGPMLAARMLRLGAEPTLLAAGPDDPAALAGKLARLLAEYPLVITTGGVSVGDRDYLPQAAEEAGAKLLFYGIDAKPGTPALAGCNCLVDVPAGSRALNAGDEVEVILL